MLSRTVRPVLRNIIARNGVAASQVRDYHPPAHHKDATMDDLPVPQGSWQADYESKQRAYNVQLIAGVTFATFTLGVILKSGLIDFNYSIPELKSE